MTPIPKYTKWAQVPAGLYTRTQLGRLDPPRRIRKDALVRGTALYHGNQYADLYALDDTDVKTAATDKQIASARRAGELRYICRWCGHLDDNLLRDRICFDCGLVLRAYASHIEGRASLGGLHQAAAGEFRPLYAAVAIADDEHHHRATRIVVIDHEAGGAVVADRELPAIGLDARGWSLREDLDAYHAAINDACGDRFVFAWGIQSGRVRDAQWDYRHWLGYLHSDPRDPPAAVGRDGDLAADARLLAVMIAAVVSGAEQPPAPCWIDRGITPAQMRPHLARYTPRLVVEFVDQLDAAADRS